MLSFARLRCEWLPNPRENVLAGMRGALARLPKAISFSIIAAADPEAAHIPPLASKSLPPGMMFAAALRLHSVE
jgi:hypothetical protein